MHLASTNPERFNRLVVAGVGRNLFERNLNFREEVAEAVETGQADNLSCVISRNYLRHQAPTVKLWQPS